MEAQLARQQKNNERDFEFAQSQFEHNKNVDQRNFDYRAKVDDRNYALKEREFNANQNYRNASLVWSSSDSSCRNTTSDGLSITI